MKWLLAIGLLTSLSAFASDSCTVGSEIYPIGAGATFYLESESAKVGPAYTCKELSRVRICEVSTQTGLTEWSNRKPECGTFDSGGCVDWWLEQLSDSAFTFSSCR
jgi:hypothetical protein